MPARWRNIWGCLLYTSPSINIEKLAQQVQHKVMPMKFKYPPDSDLRRLLRFEPDSGAIWLGDRRMVLMHTMALAALRQDLVNSVGPEHCLLYTSRCV